MNFCSNGDGLPNWKNDWLSDEEDVNQQLVPMSSQSWQEQIEAKEKQLNPLVQRAVDHVRTSVKDRAPTISSSFFYGAIGIDPKHLVIWYVVASDAEKKKVKINGLFDELNRKSREALKEAGYPIPAVELIAVSLASDEEINRAGGFRAFFA